MNRLVRRTLAASLLALAFTAGASAHARPPADPGAAAPEAPSLLQASGPGAGEAARATGGIVFEVATERTGATARLSHRTHRSPHPRPSRARSASPERSRTRALELDRLDFTERQRAARSGLLSFGSTAPPPSPHS